MYAIEMHKITWHQMVSPILNCNQNKSNSSKHEVIWRREKGLSSVKKNQIRGWVHFWKCMQIGCHGNSKLAVVSKYGVEKAIPQFYIKWITKLSFVHNIIQFLVWKPFFFYHRTKKDSSRRAKPSCMLFVFAMKTQSYLFDQKNMICFFSGNELFS